MEFRAEEYVDGVLGGEIVACRWVRLACERHRRDLETGAERGLWFDETAAKVAIAFFSVLKHWKGEWAGRPVVLEPAQQFWVWSLFGWKRADGSRRFRTGYLEVGRKNGKTTLAAGVGLFLAFVEGEPGAEVYSVGTKRDQARILHTDATEMVKQSAALKGMVGIYRNNLHQLSSGSKFEPLASDSNSLDGLNIHGAFADELHAWPSDKLWGVLKTATGARRQPLMLAITTAGINQQGICYQQRDYVARILKGIVEDDAYWGMIYTLDSKTDWPDLDVDDDWQDEGNWIKANPLLGVSKKWNTMRSDAREAANKPAELNNFLRWHLNVWTQASARWLSPVHWAACGGVVDEEALVGRRCYGGLDLSSTLDISAWVLVFPPADEDERWVVLCRFWIPEENVLERVRRDQVPYDVWLRQGWIEATPGNVIDYDWIEAQVRADAVRFDLAEAAFDPWNATSVSNHLMEDGMQMVEYRQGFVSMNPAMKALEASVMRGTLNHGNNPVLRWMADNVVAVMDPAGNMKPDKGKSREKIDGVVALLMAHYRATLAGGQRESVYKSRGLRTL